MSTLHQRRTHPVPVDGCFGCKAGTLTFGAVSGVVAQLTEREKTLGRDMDAYRRMRRAGMQPAHLGGAARVEKEARNKLEVENPRLMTLPDEARQHAAAAAVAAVDLAPALAADYQKQRSA